MTKITKYVFSVLFLAAIFAILLTAVLSIGKRSENTNKLTEQGAEYVGKDLYGNDVNSPLYSEIRVVSEPENGPSGLLESAVGKYERLWSRYTGKIEDRLTVNHPAQIKFVLCRKYFERAMGMNMTTSLTGTSNDIDKSDDLIVRQKNGQLAFLVDDFNVESRLDSFVAFARKMRSDGRNFLFFQVPTKNFEIGDEYSGVYTSYLEEKNGVIKSVMQKENIDYLYFSDYLKQNGMEDKELYFDTDHHWLPQTAQIANKALVEELNDRYGYSIDSSIYDLDNYDISYTDALFLGAQGRKVTEVYTDLESFPLLIPKYKTNLDVYYLNYRRVLSGDIADTFFNYQIIEASEQDKYTNFPYFFYGYGGLPLVQIHNKDIHDGKSVLIIKTSFGNTMYPFLSNIAEHVDVMDLRHYTGSVSEYVDATDPDTIIVIYGIAAFYKSNTNIDQMDFR